MQPTKFGAFGQRRTAAHRASCANRDGGNQHAVAADLDIIANHGAVLVGAVVVGSDTACAVVDALAHRCVTQVSQMVGFGTFGQC